VLLASDLARRSYWPAFGGGPGLDYLHRRFVPRLRAEGLGDLADQALGDNARRAFHIRPRATSTDDASAQRQERS
jgi:5-phospho-D-xylono-1,4-lactonase